jgi:hypothetical protein
MSQRKWNYEKRPPLKVVTKLQRERVHKMDQSYAEFALLPVELKNLFTGCIEHLANGSMTYEKMLEVLDSFCRNKDQNTINCCKKFCDGLDDECTAYWHMLDIAQFTHAVAHYF